MFGVWKLVQEFREIIYAVKIFAYHHRLNLKTLGRNRYYGQLSSNSWHKCGHSSFDARSGRTIFNLVHLRPIGLDFFCKYAWFFFPFVLGHSRKMSCHKENTIFLTYVLVFCSLVILVYE